MHSLRLLTCPRRLRLAAALAATAAWVHAAPAQRDSTRVDSVVVAPPAAPSTAPATAPGTRVDSARIATADTVPLVDSLLTSRARMGQRIRIRTRNVAAWAQAGKHDLAALVLYLDGRPMKGTAMTRVGPADPEVWEARLQRDSVAAGAWEAVLGSPQHFERTVRVGMGPPTGPEFSPADPRKESVALVIVRKGWFWVTLLLWAATAVLFVWLAATTGIIRDSQAPPMMQPPPDPVPEPDPAANPVREVKRVERARRKVRLKQRPFSLGRSQMAFWFFVVTTAFLGIWLITGDYTGVITLQSLMLLGLATTTAAGARIVEARRRREQEAAEVQMVHLEQQRRTALTRAAAGGAAVADMGAMDAEMREQQAAVVADTPKSPESRGFFADILNDDDEPALHRFQHVVWTVILGAVFINGAYGSLILPHLDTFLLILMGISGATYVGFKAAENQS